MQSACARVRFVKKDLAKRMSCQFCVISSRDQSKLFNRRLTSKIVHYSLLFFHVRATERNVQWSCHLLANKYISFWDAIARFKTRASISYPGAIRTGSTWGEASVWQRWRTARMHSRSIPCGCIENLNLISDTKKCRWRLLPSWTACRFIHVSVP